MYYYLKNKNLHPKQHKQTKTQKKKRNFYSEFFLALETARLFCRHRINPSTKNNPAAPAVIGTKYRTAKLGVKSVEKNCDTKIAVSAIRIPKKRGSNRSDEARGFCRPTHAH